MASIVCVLEFLGLDGEGLILKVKKLREFKYLKDIL